IPDAFANGLVKTIRLENGLNVVMMPDNSTPLLSSLVVIRTGSSYETAETAGSTHLLEHMLFRGTENRTQGEIYDELDLMGAYNNAQTQKTNTNFILVVPSKHAQQAMEIQADMILSSTIPADSFEVEKGRVIAELQQSLNRSSYLCELEHIKNVFDDCSYGQPTLGSMESIKAATREHVYSFYKSWYAVNNMTLVLRGDKSFKEMENLAKSIYGEEAPVELPDHPTNWIYGLQSDKAGRLHVSYAEIQSGFLMVSFNAPRFDNADHPAFALLQEYIDEKLDKSLSEHPGLTTYNYSDLANDPAFSVLTINIGLIPGANPEEVLEIVLNTITEISNQSFEMSDVRTKIDQNKQSELFFAEQVQYGAFLLVPKLAIAPYGFWDHFEIGLVALTADRLHEVAQKWLTNPSWIATSLLPDHEDTELSATIMLDNYSSTEPPFIDEIKLKTRYEHAMNRFSDPQWQMSTTVDSDSTTGGGVQLGETLVDTLENGFVIVARQVEGAPVAGIHLIAKHRAAHEWDEKRGWADVLHRLLLSSWADQDELNRRMTSIGMDIATVDDSRIPMDDYRTTPEYSYVRIQALSGSWAKATGLLAELIESEDQISQTHIDDAANELKGIIGRSSGRVSGAARQTLADNLYGNVEMGMPVYGDGSSLDSISLDEILDFRREYFSADNLILSVFAPDSPEKIIDQINSQFGSLKTTLYELQLGKPVSTPVEVEVTGSGSQGYLASGFLIEELPVDQLAPLLIANVMISDLIYRDLGEKKGWAYGAGSSLVMRDGWGAWKTTMGLPEEHLRESQAAVMEHLNRIRSGDFDEHRMEVARQSMLGSMLRRYSSRINLAMAASTDHFQFRDPEFTWKFFDQVNAATIDDVKSAAEKYLNYEGKMVTVYGLPEKTEGMQAMPPGMGGMGGMGSH
ncbi:insulinase family protein, partial [bacterium]|nr:insulinase family protein [bacterium]